MVSGSTSIPLATRRGTVIANSQSPDVAKWEVALAESFYGEKHPRVTYRTGHSGFYNCHGLVFASRRTQILHSDDVFRILEEDCYQEVESIAKVEPGDVIIYFDSDGDIEHSGIVVKKPTRKTLNVPFVVSKWGPWREVLHAANDCPYSLDSMKYYRVCV